ACYHRSAPRPALPPARYSARTPPRLRPLSARRRSAPATWTTGERRRRSYERDDASTRAPLPASNRFAKSVLRYYAACTASMAWFDVTFADPFWAPRLNLVRQRTLPALHKQLRDSGRIDALRLRWVPGMHPVPHQFWDSDVAKWLEAASYSLA